MRLNTLSAKSLLPILLALALNPAYAEEAAAPISPDGAKPNVASLKAAIIDGLNIDASQPILYQDEQGNPIDETTFFTSMGQGHAINATKVKEDGKLVVTLKLQSKEEQQNAAKPLAYNIKPGDALPAFELKQLAGGNIADKQLLGHTTLVNFYFSECAPCRKEVADLNTLATSRPDMKFLAVTFDDAKEAGKFVKETRFEWAIAPDAAPFINQLGVKTYPSFALIDAQGKLVAITTHAEIEGSEDHSVAKWLDRLHPLAKAN